MGDLLHVGALAPAAIGASCIAADRRQARAPELATALLMLLAMLDVMVWEILPAPLWSALLVSAAGALAAIRGRAARHRAGGHAVALPSAGMTVHTSFGVLIMGMLTLAMTPEGGISSAEVEHHGVASAPFALVCATIAIAYGVGSVLLAWRPDGGSSAAERGGPVRSLAPAAMGLSTAAMGLALLV